ncbi:hypothetical protein ACFVFH_05030 [Streptomyces sp. NPDC057697]|uniref:hypothetical protein n=1 Tax=Streptomyces sp. NPDC057697 TaxID=3346219 RepID=UPI0036823F65
MSGDNFHIAGDNVNVHGTGNIGMVKNMAPAAVSPELQAALAELTVKLQELRAVVAPADAQRIDAALPALAPDAAVQPQARFNALTAIAGIVATAGSLREPIESAVNGIRQLLGL